MLFDRMSTFLSIIVNGFSDFFGILTSTVGDWLASSFGSTENGFLSAVIDFILGTAFADVTVFGLFFGFFGFFIALHFIFLISPLK